MEIRLEGFPHEIERLMKAIDSSPEISLARVSREYANRNSVYVRRYISIEFTEKEVSQDA